MKNVKFKFLNKLIIRQYSSLNTNVFENSKVKYFPVVVKAISSLQSEDDVEKSMGMDNDGSYVFSNFAPAKKSVKDNESSSTQSSIVLLIPLQCSKSSKASKEFREFSFADFHPNVG